MSRRDFWASDWPPRAKARRPADGIKAQSKRGAFAAGWWAKRWIAVLTGFDLGARLARGRSYARSGQVTQIALERGGVRAQVQGSRAKPYEVTIRLSQLEAREWSAIGAAISANVRLAAALLAGEMPEDIETAFRAANASLFPASAKEMKTACSCPDWSNPCKHVAAVFYLIGEEFDRDPFLLFVIRGLAREDVRDLFAAVSDGDGERGSEAASADPVPRRRRAAAAVTRSAKKTTRPSPANAPLPPPTAAITATAFWGVDAPAAGVSRPARVVISPADEVAVLKRAGKFPFWRGDMALDEAVMPIYRDAAAFALEWLAERAEK